MSMRQVSPSVVFEFQCDREGCPNTERSDQGTPRGWADVSVEYYRSTRTHGSTRVQWHLCPDHSEDFELWLPNR